MKLRLLYDWQASYGSHLIPTLGLGMELVKIELDQPFALFVFLRAESITKIRLPNETLQYITGSDKVSLSVNHEATFKDLSPRDGYKIRKLL